MNDSISQQDIQRLARVSCEMVNELDFEESATLERSCQPMRKLLTDLLARYNNELLFDALTAVSRKPVSKLDIYTATRDIIRLARGVPEALPMAPATMLAERRSMIPVHASVS